MGIPDTAHDPADEPVVEPAPPEPRMRCLRCNATFPESELGVHRRLHRAHAIFVPDWIATDEFPGPAFHDVP